jgi:iron complex transport system substrate-binding protein
MKRSSRGLGVGVLLVALALSVPAGAAAAFPLRVRDALGRDVAIARPPQRLISVAPSVTEILFALALDDHIIGVSDADEYPPAGVRSKARVGGIVLDAERILSLHPDLIVGVASLQRAQLERLIRLGLPVLAVDAHSLEETFSQISLLGRATGRAERADRLVRALRRRAALVGQRVGGRARPRVYVEIWGEPPMTAGSGTFIHDLVKRAGGVNLFADLRGWPQVSPEDILRRDPEVILLTYPGRQLLPRRPGWSRIAAVRRGRIYEVHADLVSRPGPRLVNGLEQIARFLHPEVFSPP